MLKVTAQNHKVAARLMVMSENLIRSCSELDIRRVNATFQRATEKLLPWLGQAALSLSLTLL